MLCWNAAGSGSLGEPQRWHSFRLNTPGWMNAALGGLAPDAYPTAVEVVERLNGLGAQAPVREAPCPCRIPRPSRSRGMLVLVENAAEAVASSYVEAGYLGRIGDLRGQRAQRAGVRDALVRAVFVVKRLS